MKNSIILLFVFVCVFSVKANNIDPNRITIPKEYKTEKTFSGNLSGENSFHLIFTKNKQTRNFEVFTYLFDGVQIEKLPNIISNKSYSVVSFHQKNDVLTLLLSYTIKKKSFLKRINYNLITKNKTDFQSFSNNDFSTCITQKQRSILVYKSRLKLKILDFNGDESPLKKEYVFKDPRDAVHLFLKGKSIAFVKTDEFVQNGSTNITRLYFENNTLFFTRDSDEPLNVSIAGFSLNSKKKNITQVLRIDLNDSELLPRILTFENRGGEKFKKATSFFSNNKLFQLALSKKMGFINIADVNTGKSLNNFSLEALMNSQIKGNPEFQGIETFLKNAGRNKYNATITANKTINNRIRIRVDYVDITYSYNYNYDWFWQQHQQFHMQNVQINSPSGFGPRVINEDAFLNATISKGKRFFEVLIDVDGNLLNEELPHTFYKDIDKKKYIDKIEDVDNFKYQSSCFLSESFRFIAYNKRLNHFTVQKENLQ